MHALFACALLAGTAAHAAAPDVHVRLFRTDAIGAVQIGLYGSADAACAPEVARVSLDGSNLSIELKSPDAACDGSHRAPFALRIDPMTSIGMAVLPAQVYRVRIYAADGNSERLLSFHLLDTAATSAPAPEAGLWWSQASDETGPAAPGNGASIEMQDGKLAVGWLGFNDLGAATWYFGSATPTGRVASIALVQLANGDPPFSPMGNVPSAQPGPRLEIEFLSPTRARAYLVRTEAGRDTVVRVLSLARSRFSSGPATRAWTGQWVLVPDDSGTPRVFEFSQAGNQDVGTFHLADSANDASLDCRIGHDGQSPEVCAISAGGTTLADFDQVGIDHLMGHDSNGARVKLLRVPR